MAYLPDAEPYALSVIKGNISGTTIFEKFGRNGDIDTGTAEDVWHGGGDYTGFPTGSAEIMEIASSDANDTAAGTGARTVRIYGLLDGTGAAVADQDVTLNGTSYVDVHASNTYYRGGARIKVLTAGSGGENAGTLTLRHKTTTANIFAVMPATMNQTAVAAWTVPLGQTLYISRISIQMARANGAAGSAHVSIRSRPDGAVFNTTVSPEVTDSHGYEFANNGFFTFAARTDIKARVESVSDNNTIVTAEFGGFLVDD